MEKGKTFKWTRMQQICIAILGLVFFTVIIFIQVPSCDDHFFRVWEFSSLKDMFLLHPSNLTGATFIPQNGRYLGNILGLFLSRTYAGMPGNIIRTVIVVSGILAMTLLIGRILNLSGRVWILLMLLILMTLVHLYVQVYHWTAGFANYFPPVVGFLALLYCLKACPKQKGVLVLVLCLAVATQLFTEPMTVYTFSFFSVWCLRQKVKGEAIPDVLKVIWVGVFIGAIFMFSYPGYYNTQERYGSVGLGDSLETLRALSFDVVISNVFLWIVAIFEMSRLKCHSLKVQRGILVLYIPFFVYSLARVFFVITGQASYRRLDIVAASLFMVLIIAQILNIKRSKIKTYCLIWLSSILFINGMLLFLSPISARCAYISFTLTVLWVMDLVSHIPLQVDAEKSVRGFLVVASVAACFYCGFLALKFYQNYQVYCEMNAYLEREMGKKSEALYLPEYENDWLIWEGNPLIYYLYSIYYETPRDVYLEVVPYDYWKSEFNNCTKV